MKQYILLNPGPCNVSDDVRSALAVPDMCHREAEYFACQDEVRDLLIEVFGLDPTVYAAILLTGSGTAAMEAAIASAPVDEGGKLLIINNGVYGDRLAQMARAHRIESVELTSGWTEQPDLEALGQMLDDDPAIQCVATVHHETTTGLINPLNAIAEIVHSRGRELIVDSISGLAGEALDFDAAAPAYTICTANKCAQGLPGIAFVIAKREVLARVAEMAPRSVYFDLPNYLAKQDHSNTPFTPAVQVLFAFRQALVELKEETVAGRIARYAEASSIVRNGLQKLGLSLLLPEEKRSNTITTITLPDGFTYDMLHDALKELGYVIYAGQGELRKRCFRIANMGLIPHSELHRLVQSIGELIDRGRQ